MSTTSFRCLLIGLSLTNFANVLYTVALITLVYKTTGNVAFSALVPFFVAAAYLVSGASAPLIQTRLSLRNILLVFQAGKSLLLLLLVWFVGTGLTTTTVFVVLAFVFAISVFDGWVNPARNALVPMLVEPAHLVKANSLLSTVDQTVQFIGWASGGLLIIYIGGVPVLWGTLALVVLSTLLVLPIQQPIQTTDPIAEQRSTRDALRIGWLTIWRTPILRTVALMDFFEGIVGAIWIGALTLVYVEQILERGEEWWGFINAAYLIGSVVGGLLVFVLAKIVNRHLGLSMIIGSLSFAVFTLIFGLTSSPLVALLLCVLMGPVYQLRDIAQRTIFQHNVEPTLLAKVLSAQGTLYSTTFLLSVLLMSLIAEAYGIRSVYYVGAACTATSGLLALINKKTFSTSRKIAE